MMSSAATELSTKEVVLLFVRERIVRKAITLGNTFVVDTNNKKAVLSNNRSSTAYWNSCFTEFMYVR